MNEFPTVYTNTNSAVRKAVLNLSGRDFNAERLDKGLKKEYENFGWIVALAPADDPQIAVACMVVQGGGSVNVSPIVREILGDYFDLQDSYAESGLNVDYSMVFQKNIQN